MSFVGNWAAAENRKALEDDLLEILFGAVKFAQLLRRQRACWSVRYFGHVIQRSWKLKYSQNPMFFDEATMYDKDEDEDSDGKKVQLPFKRIVEIVVSLGLFKRGNTDGERFEYDSCMEKSEVKCGKTWTGAGHVETQERVV